jgi:hypothetical protein
MDGHDLPGQDVEGTWDRPNPEPPRYLGTDANSTQSLLPSHLIGLHGRLARPFWGILGLWSVLCGALASNQLRLQGDELLTLVLVLLLADLAWGNLWDLAVGFDWFGLLAQGWPVQHAPRPKGLPYTQPHSPGGRIFGALGRLGAWWRETFWPAGGPALLGVIAAAALAIVLNLLLPDRLHLLNALLVALVGLGLVLRRRGKAPLAGTALVQVGLCWLAGHMAFAPLNAPSLVLALVFTLAVWGALRVAQQKRGALWLQNGGQVVAVALVAALRQPLAAGLAGLLLLGQVALQPSLRQGGNAARIFRRGWPWLMAAMLLAALAVR